MYDRLHLGISAIDARVHLDLVALRDTVGCLELVALEVAQHHVLGSKLAQDIELVPATFDQERVRALRGRACWRGRPKP